MDAQWKKTFAKLGKACYEFFFGGITTFLGHHGEAPHNSNNYIALSFVDDRELKNFTSEKKDR